MELNERLFTSESVTSGHPDKVCDQIADAILDAILTQDRNARVAVEATVTTGQVHVFGEVTTDAYVEIPAIVREVITSIGYTSSKVGFDGELCGVNVAIGQQSPDIAAGVTNSLEARAGATDLFETQGAGDQGLVFGYACDETDALMPLPIHLAHRLAERLEQARTLELIPGLRPDGKTQATIRYLGDRPTAVDTVVVSTQHDPDVTQAALAQTVAEVVVAPVLANLEVDSTAVKILVNPSGNFVVGGPAGDSGLTGRKLIVDTYGGMARHGGGSFSGKDPSKMDRSAAYAMRWIAKNLVGAQLARRVEVQVAYAIGLAHPVSVHVDTFGTGQYSDQKIAAAISEVFDLRPAAIIAQLDLLRPIYRATTNYGHFGRPGFSWEATDKVNDLLAAV
ncbi:MAG: methionine adenosyltransferase [Propionibacteriaceae bacterium]|nr:methionine adenosyltransferase [Propionibacteriaceae bacterium]